MQIEIATMSKDTFLTLKKACEIAKFDFPKLPKIKTSDLKEVIGGTLCEYFETRNSTLYLIQTRKSMISTEVPTSSRWRTCAK